MVEEKCVSGRSFLTAGLGGDQIPHRSHFRRTRFQLLASETAACHGGQGRCGGPSLVTNRSCAIAASVSLKAPAGAVCKRSPQHQNTSAILEETVKALSQGFLLKLETFKLGNKPYHLQLAFPSLHRSVLPSLLCSPSLTVLLVCELPGCRQSCL